MQLGKLEELNKYITILIVDDEDAIRNSIYEVLDQEGYLNVWTVERAEEAVNYLPKTNILLTDCYLDPKNKNKKSGIDLIRYAKGKFGENIEAILFTAEDDEVKKQQIKQDAINVKAAAYFEKPFHTEYIKLWIKELGKRIWLQQILDNNPDEVVIIDRSGTIFLVDKEKEEIFGKELIGDKCYKRFEVKESDNKMCENCPCTKAYDGKQKIRTEWEYITRGDILKHTVHQKEQTVDIITAPLYDIQKEPRAIIEISRDMTQQKVVEKTIGEMEKKSDWKESKKIFIEGFMRLGYPRGELYLRFPHEGKDEFRKIDQWGNNDSNLPTIINVFDDRPSQLVIEHMQPFLFIVDHKHNDRGYERDKVINNLFFVGKERVRDYNRLGSNEWIEVPLHANGEVIGKVTMGGWSQEESPDSYDLEVLAQFGSAAGQIIQNARQRRDIESRVKMGQAILEISKEITDITKSPDPLQNAVKRAVEIMKIGMCSIFLQNEDSGKLEVKHSYGQNINGEELSEEHFKHENLIGGGALTRQIFDEGRPRYINNDELEEIIRKEKKGDPKGIITIPVLNQYQKILGEPFRNCLFVPLIVGEKKMGLLRAVNKSEFNDFGVQNFDHHDTEMFELLAGQIAVAFYNSLLQKEKENYLEVIMHSIRASLQDVFTVAGKFTEKKPLNWDEVKKYGADLEHSLSKSKNLIEEFSFISRPKDPQNYEFESYPVCMLITEVKEWIKSRIAIILELNAIGLAMISGDKRQLQHALHNIIDNAIKYSLSDDKPVIISGEVVSEFIRIDVINFSKEISDKEREVLFKGNYRAPWVRKVSSGLGIGLALTKKIIDKHGGKIEVTSIPDEGSLYRNTFSIYLPLERVNQNEQTCLVD